MARAGSAVESHNWLAVGFVSLYLCGVGLYLIVTRKIPAPGFRRVVRAMLRSPYAGTVTGFAPEAGHCFLASVPAHLLSDLESRSWLQLYEDDRPLGPGHAPHDEIRRMGAGRFSHWGEQLYFSASDNSDPRSNGRHYRVAEARR